MDFKRCNRVVLAALIFVTIQTLSCSKKNAPAASTGGTTPSSNPSSQTDGLDLTDHRIFVSSTASSPNFGGVSGADTFCATKASAAGLTRTYKAVLSTSTANAKDRLSITGSVYYFTDASTKVLVATSSTDLWDSSISNAINRTETYATIAGVVMTGTTAAGTVSTGETCNDWVSNDLNDSARYGSTTNVNGRWVYHIIAGFCDSAVRVYCISQ